MNLVKGKWLFTLNRYENGKVIKFRPRNVGRGSRQKRGVDLQETYSHTVKMVTLRILLVEANRCEEGLSRRSSTTVRF